jgi:hypothetical protein
MYRRVLARSSKIANCLALAQIIMIESGNRGELGQTEQRTRQWRPNCNERADERLPFPQPEPKAAAERITKRKAKY